MKTKTTKLSTIAQRTLNILSQTGGVYADTRGVVHVRDLGDDGDPGETLNGNTLNALQRAGLAHSGQGPDLDNSCWHWTVTDKGLKLVMESWKRATTKKTKVPMTARLPMTAKRKASYKVTLVRTMTTTVTIQARSQAEAEQLADEWADRPNHIDWGWGGNDVIEVHGVDLVEKS